MRILGIPGSLREQSYNRLLLGAGASALPEGVYLDIYEGLAQIPPFDEDDETPTTVRSWRNAVAGAQAVLIATPEYNGSIPGQLKNALDWASRPFPNNVFRGKPVAVVGASTGLFGAVWAQADLRRVLGKMGAQVIDEELPVGQAHQAFRPDGALKDPEMRSALADLLGLLIDAVPVPEERSA